MFPSLVEACIMKHPNVDEVVVFGIPVNDYEEELCAWVRLKSTREPATSVEEIKKYCQDNLLSYQVPRHFKLVESFPVNTLGKYMRHMMSSEYRKELGL